MVYITKYRCIFVYSESDAHMSTIKSRGAAEWHIISISYDPYFVYTFFLQYKYRYWIQCLFLAENIFVITSLFWSCVCVKIAGTNIRHYMCECSFQRIHIFYGETSQNSLFQCIWFIVIFTNPLFWKTTTFKWIHCFCTKTWLDFCL